MDKIGSPLFILRDYCANDLFTVLERLAALDFDGVEFLSTFGHPYAKVKKRLDACGLKAIGDHVGFDEFSNDPARLIENHQTLGCEYITIGPPPPDGQPGGPNYARVLETLHKLCEQTIDGGMYLLYHNHADEIKRSLNGKTILEHYADDCPPLQLEPDLGWMHIGGGDPAYYLHKYGNRCPVIHFKDFIPNDSENAVTAYPPVARNGEMGYKSGEFEFRPTGYGVVNTSGLYAVARTIPSVQWYIVDHDCAYNRDIYEELILSRAYMNRLYLLHAR